MKSYYQIAAFTIFALLPMEAWGHGFTVEKIGNSLFTFNDEATPVHERLFAAAPFNSLQSPMTINEPSLALGGFSGGDVLSFDVADFLKWNGSLVNPGFAPAPLDAEMTLTHRFLAKPGSPLTVNGNTLDVPGFDWKTQGDTHSSHAVQYSMPGATPDGVYFLGITPTGRDSFGNAFGPAETVYFAFNVDVDANTYLEVQEAFAATLVPEPAGATLAILALVGFARFRHRRSARS